MVQLGLSEHGPTYEHVIIHPTGKDKRIVRSEPFKKFFFKKNGHRQRLDDKEFA